MLTCLIQSHTSLLIRIIADALSNYVLLSASVQHNKRNQYKATIFALRFKSDRSIINWMHQSFLWARIRSKTSKKILRYVYVHWQELLITSREGDSRHFNLRKAVSICWYRHYKIGNSLDVMTAWDIHWFGWYRKKKYYVA